MNGSGIFRRAEGRGEKQRTAVEERNVRSITMTNVVEKSFRSSNFEERGGEMEIYTYTDVGYKTPDTVATMSKSKRARNGLSRKSMDNVTTR